MPDLQCQYRDIDQKAGEIWAVRVVLEAALFRPQIGYYNDIIAEAAALLENLAINHPFVAGNKRIAFATTDAPDAPRCAKMRQVGLVKKIPYAIFPTGDLVAKQYLIVNRQQFPYKNSSSPQPSKLFPNVNIGRKNARS